MNETTSMTITNNNKSVTPNTVTTNHRPVTSCTHCRQQKIKCNALENQPKPCTRCGKLNLICNIDPNFKPKKGSQLQKLKDEIQQLKKQITNLNNLITYDNGLQTSIDINEKLFKINDFNLSFNKANFLLINFNNKFLKFLPIIDNYQSPQQLFLQSKLLFWAIILTSHLSYSNDPSDYIKLSNLVKLLITRNCYLNTPRSTHISQALLILSNWPLPNSKVLDDLSYRFLNLSKSLSFQLGLHRSPEFIQEFSRNQKKLDNADYWRSKTWLGVFFQDLLWSSILGLPPCNDINYILIDNINLSFDNNTSSSDIRFTKLLNLAKFQLLIFKKCGNNQNQPDGLLNLENERNSTLLNLLNKFNSLQDLLNSSKTPDNDDIVIKIYTLYVKLMICCYAFFPIDSHSSSSSTPTTQPSLSSSSSSSSSNDFQKRFILIAYHCATEIVTLITKLTESFSLIELPIYMRQSCSFAAWILFKLQFTTLLPEYFFNSTRQSIVTIHRLYRNQYFDWKINVENDISRTASILEKLNFVLITHPEIFVNGNSKDNNNNNNFLINKMRSHLTNSIFYDLVWCIHEAKRREKLKEKTSNSNQSNNNDSSSINNKNLNDNPLYRRSYPLPLYYQLSKENFDIKTVTSSNGTTITKLIPTKQAMSNKEAINTTNTTTTSTTTPNNNTNNNNNNNYTMKTDFNTATTTTNNANNMNPKKDLNAISSVNTNIEVSPNTLDIKNIEENVGKMINGIPLSILEETGSVDLNFPILTSSIDLSDHENNNNRSSIKQQDQKIAISRRNQYSLSSPSLSTTSSTTQKQNRPASFDSTNNRNSLDINSSKYILSSQSLFNHVNKVVKKKKKTNLHSIFNNPYYNNAITEKNLMLFNTATNNAINENPTGINNYDPVTPNSNSATNLNLQTDNILPNNNNNTKTNNNNILNQQPKISNNIIPNTFQNLDSNNIINGGNNVLSEFDNFFQQQSAGWIEAEFNNDDFLGFVDMDLEPEL